MLSYRHSYHAGNFADVIKHIVIVEVIEYLSQKDKAFEYIDTHAGAGLFHLKSEHATKLQEYSNGIAKLRPQDWPELDSYLSCVSSFNTDGSLEYYPGSPVIAKQLVRSHDKAWLYELHPADFELLQNNIGHDRRIRLRQDDGFKGLLGLLPPLSRRGLVLIDPPYEMKTDYDTVFKTVTLAHKKFASGTYAIWYPVVDRRRIEQLQDNFINSGIKNIQRFELALTADSAERGMTASGMIVINPPWTLMAKMSQLLPRLVDTLGEDDGANYTCDVLVGE